MTIETIINNAWEKRAELSTNTKGEIRDAVQSTLNDLDSGKIRVAEKQGEKWITHEWIKKAVLLSFRLNEMEIMPGTPTTNWYDKVPNKFAGWNETQFEESGFRAVPGCWVRHAAYIAPNVILMPSFVNIGAYVDEGTMIDTWATVGSCAQIGKNCHISGGAGIGGVLEPLQATPTIIEDDCFIGARAEVAEGVIVEKGSVLSMGVYIGASTRVFDRETGETYFGRVPAGSVVVPGTLPGSKGDAHLYAAIIVKKVDEKTRSKTSINEILRAA